MVRVGPDEKIYPVFKVAKIVEALAAEGVPFSRAADGLDLTQDALASPATRVSLNQVMRCCHTAVKLARDPLFAWHTGLKWQVTLLGMVGFGILSSTNFRQTEKFVAKYSVLASPTADATFKEKDGEAGWTLVPAAYPELDAALNRFVVELQFGIYTSIIREIMSPSFNPLRLHVTYRRPADLPALRRTFGCDVLFEQADNQFIFDAAWLDRKPRYGDPRTHAAMAEMCERLLEQLHLHTGLAGKVRELLLANLAQPLTVEDVAAHLNMTERTLRRRLSEEGTSFRKLVDELKMHVAIKYLRDTDLTVEDIAGALDFSDAANFRHAFRRWTKRAPQDFRTDRASAALAH